ncbi:MAG: NADP-dependent phosphogluconate dehydrogenase [Candidatus Levybacteria bacterium]|nr:NADP-dependent phosphogluconate dehydrogenase [Candidatus Levybacteria bacterium]
MKLGLIGLGRMGGNMAMKLVEDGHALVVWSRSKGTVDKFREEIKNQKSKIKDIDQKLKIASSLEDLVKSLEKPRVVWSMVLVGEPTDQILSELEKYVEKDDIIIEGSNANWKDTQRRYDHFIKKGIRYLGTGVSGGVHGPKLGYALMAGGNKSAYDYVKPVFDTLVKPTASHGYFGSGGAGHFVKMIHNGIEYAYMQAIGEGFDVLEHSPYKFDLLKIAKLWQKCSLISGFMMDRAVEAIEKDPHMDTITGVVDATGEAQWTVDTAKELGIPVEIIEHSLDYRKRSKTDKKIQNSYTAKMVAALRHAFGAHAVRQAQGKAVKKK